MKVNLKFITPLDMVVDSIRTCYSSNWNTDSKWVLTKDLKAYNDNYYVVGIRDKELINQCIENAHESVLRHSLIHFEVKEFPRNILQQVVRHGVGISYSVQSTRFTTKKAMKAEDTFATDNGWDLARVAKYIYLTGNDEIDNINITTLEKVRQLAHEGKIPNDELKHLLPECFNCDFRASFNIQSLRHFLQFRTASDAHTLIRQFSFMMYDSLPMDYKFLFSDVVSPA